jgi:hypothetical protein
LRTNYFIRGSTKAECNNKYNDETVGHQISHILINEFLIVFYLNNKSP